MTTTKNRIVGAVELGSSKITTLVAQVSTDPATFDRQVSIVGVATVPASGIKKGQIVDIEATVDSAISCVEAAERMAGYNLDRAYIALGGAHLASQNSHGVVAVSDPNGEISHEDVERVIEAASAISLPTSREVVHVLPREFSVDGETGVKDAIGMSGVRLEVETHIITASNAAIKNVKKAVNEIGIEVEDMVFSGLASSYSVLTETEKELGCVLVDIGGGTTSIAVFLDGALAYSSVLPIGGKNVTNDLAIGLRVSLESAEKIKLLISDAANQKKKEAPDEIDLSEMGVAEVKKVSKKTLTEGIIRPRLNEIFTMVRLGLEKDGFINRVPSGVIVTGGGAETVGVIDSAKRMLSLPARLGVPRGVTGLIDDIINPSFATPIGLILYGASDVSPDSGNSFAKKFKLPTKGVAGKLIEMVKNLLP